MRLSWMRCKSLLYLAAKLCTSFYTFCAPGTQKLNSTNSTNSTDNIKQVLGNKGSDTMAVKHCVQKIHKALPRSSTKHLNVLKNPWNDRSRAITASPEAKFAFARGGSVTQSQNNGPDNRPKSEHLWQDQKVKLSLFKGYGDGLISLYTTWPRC